MENKKLGLSKLNQLASVLEKVLFLKNNILEFLGTG